MLLNHLNDSNIVLINNDHIIDHEGYSMTKKHGWHVVMLLVLLAQSYVEY